MFRGERVVVFHRRTVVLILGLQVVHHFRVDDRVARPGPQVDVLTTDVAYRVHPGRILVGVDVVFGRCELAAVKAGAATVILGGRYAVLRAIVRAAGVDCRAFECAGIGEVQLHGHEAAGRDARHVDVSGIDIVASERYHARCRVRPQVGLRHDAVRAGRQLASAASATRGKRRDHTENEKRS